MYPDTAAAEPAAAPAHEPTAASALLGRRRASNGDVYYFNGGGRMDMRSSLVGRWGVAHIERISNSEGWRDSATHSLLRLAARRCVVHFSYTGN